MSQFLFVGKSFAKSFISSVEAFVPAYENQLQEEEKTFTSFGAEDANFNTLYDGVNALNSISNDNLKILEPIIDLSVEFETQKRRSNYGFDKRQRQLGGLLN